MELKQNRREILIYCAWIYGLTFLFNAVCLLIGNPEVFLFPVSSYQMIIPGAVALVMMRKKPDAPENGLYQKPVHSICSFLSVLSLSLLIPLMVPALSIVLLERWISHPSWSFRPDIFLRTDLWSSFPIVLMFSAGEEIGWRGHLFRRMRTWGLRRSAVVVGVIWTFWHFFLYWSIYPMNDFVVSYFLVYFPTVVSLSAVISYLYIRTWSLWPAIFFHMMYDLRIQILGLDEVLQDVRSFTLCEAILWVLAGAIALLLLEKHEKK